MSEMELTNEEKILIWEWVYDEYRRRWQMREPTLYLCHLFDEFRRRYLYQWRSRADFFTSAEFLKPDGTANYGTHWWCHYDYGSRIKYLEDKLDELVSR